MPFGLKTAPATFHRAMEIAVAGLTFETCLCYLDDIIVFGRDFEEHNSQLRTVLKRFRQFNLKVNLSKCVFAARQVCYLGHVILQQGVAPSDLKQLHIFLGLTGNCIVNCYVLKWRHLCLRSLTLEKTNGKLSEILPSAFLVPNQLAKLGN